jgi:hypothetical protein
VRLNFVFFTHSLSELYGQRMYIVAFPLQQCLHDIILRYMYTAYPANVEVPKWVYIVLNVMDMTCVFNSPGCFGVLSQISC